MEKQVYFKAYVELYELIKHLSIEEQNKIPDTYKNNLLKNMDKNYEFSIDPCKTLNEQNYMDETKALYINLYDMYLANEHEKVVLKQYHKIAHNLIENEKKSKYNIDDIFSKNDMPKNNSLNSDNINENKILLNNNNSLQDEGEHYYRKATIQLNTESINVKVENITSSEYDITKERNFDGSVYVNEGTYTYKIK